jgi:hypothetical protein
MPKKKIVKLKRTKKPRLKKLSGPGTVVDAKNWRRVYRDGGYIQFDDLNKLLFLKEIAKTGQFMAATQSCGVSSSTVRKHLKDDPEFNEAYMDARETYKDIVISVAQKLALEGIDEPMIGGRNRDEVVAYKKVYATNILAMEMKRVDPGYKDKSQVDLNVRSGVLLLPEGKSMEDWEKENL